MLNQTLKTAFMAQAEQPGSLINLAELLRQAVAPAVLAGYQSESVGDLENLIRQGDWQAVSFRAAQNFELEAVLMLPLLLTRISFVAPEETLDIMDALVAGWTAGENPHAKMPTLARNSPLSNITRQIPAALQELFWQYVADDSNIIEKVFSLQATFDTDLHQAYAEAMLQHVGTPEAYAEGYLRGPLAIEDLRDYSAGTLGYAYYHQIVDNGLDIEILKGEQPRAKAGSLISYVNRRILQTHDLWHCVTEYTTQGDDEIILQAFQLAQLGSPFSPNLMAILLTQAALFSPQNIPYLMRYICAGWQHGRSNPPFLPIKWEQHWGETLEAIRQQYHLTPKRAELSATSFQNV